MIIRLIKRTKIYNFHLPTTVEGNYWITDLDNSGNVRNLINVEEDDGNWRLNSNFDTKIVVNNKEIDSVILKEYSLYFLKINSENDYIILYCSPSVDPVISKLKVPNSAKIVIGNGSNCHINYNYPLVSKAQACLIYENSNWFIEDLGSKYGTYVNNELITKKPLYHGDIVFIMGLKIIVLGDTIILNNIGNLVSVVSNYFSSATPIIQPVINDDNLMEENVEFFKEEDYFFRSPRFKAGIEPVEITIDAPPTKQQEDDTPMILVLGPMLGMGMTSLLTGYNAVSGIMGGNATFKSSLPTLITCLAMLLAMVLWPILNKSYQKRKIRRREKERQEKYTAYIQEKKQKIASEMEKQKQALIENNITLDECSKIILNRKRNLWEREIDQSDFLNLRIGIGNLDFQGKVNYPEERFSLDDDNLQQLVFSVGRESKMLENVPINFSLINHNIVALIGDGKQKKSFIDGLILQMMTFHSYEDVKIVLFTNEKNAGRWDYLKVLPHCWNDSKTVRYFATNNDEAKELSLHLEQEFQSRKFRDSDHETKNLNYLSYKPYYVIISDDFKAIRELEIIKDICNQDVNIGYSLMIVNNRITNLPNECHSFISIGDTMSGLFENELVSNKQKEFVADYNESINMYECSKALFNIPIEVAKQESNLPTMLSFLEMYDVGKVEQLNILNRWKTNDPTKSLQAPVGVDKNRELFKLDLHEKFYGPHGLIAGMTGSGKSEFIITYILSMAINYSPNEVSFILIDYKGGGLAGAFQNKETGMKLPHLAGSITNLDTVEMNRSLASIQSELRRRQKIFNEARDSLNESTIDIYKYQALFREGLVKEPVTHLFIISDEFAELKQQQPEFMTQLISTARIGRSLGVHLILATQKPAGVVDDQIWSNSKFRVCLKVQDKSDSMDMIKCPDAAALKEVGRFYLQVGYNELFALGQSAWTGAKYYPMDKRRKKTDERIVIVDNIGNSVKSLETVKKDMSLKPQGEEITNIIKYLVNVSEEQNIRVKQLWLDRIPEFIYVEKLREKYSYLPQKFVINPIIGEFDDPNNQRQDLLTLPLSAEGNTIIYGSSGNGKELLLTTLIYSAIVDHSPEEVNFYILDFGGETLKSFSKAPQVGDIVLSSEEEKVANLFKMLTSNLEERKKLFVDYNGDYNFYCTHSGKTLPTIITIINNYDSYYELYEDYDEQLSQLTREGTKYGLIFVVTSNNVNSIRYRLKQNFKQNLVLQFNDPSDYSSILGNIDKKYPSKLYGRGLVLLDNVYEFQTAYPYNHEKMAEYIRTISLKLADLYTDHKARNIPILPKEVTKEFVSDYLNNMETLPVGVFKDSLNIATLNCIKNYSSIISSSDVSEHTSFIYNLIDVFKSINNLEITVIDTMQMFDENDGINLINTQFEERLNPLLQDMSDNYVKYRDSNYDNSIFSDTNKKVVIISGLTELLNRLSVDKKNEFTTAISMIKDLGIYHIVIVDNDDKLKQQAYEQWYRSSIDTTNGVWLGNGILDQSVLKLSVSPRELREDLDKGFGVLVYKGKPYIIKLLGGIEDE
ncbi:MAG: type VII secretion protein EssC [Bacilli bacterium]|nr:type VII secretion protein EssC [Bacilli bacterium]